MLKFNVIYLGRVEASFPTEQRADRWCLALRKAGRLAYVEAV